MSLNDPKPGDPLFVPSTEAATALSLGAVMVEGDARLFIPSILPDGVSLRIFSRWMTDECRMVWIGELLESVVGGAMDIMNIAGLVSELSSDQDADLVPLYVPKSEMDDARIIPGVWWDRNRRMYVADRSADFALVHKYLTPAMRSAWIADRNLEAAMTALVRARAMVSDDHGEDKDALELGREQAQRQD